MSPPELLLDPPMLVIVKIQKYLDLAYLTENPYITYNMF